VLCFDRISKNPHCSSRQVPETPVASSDDTTSSPSDLKKVFLRRIVIHAIKKPLSTVSQDSSSVIFLTIAGGLTQQLLILPHFFSHKNLPELEARATSAGGQHPVSLHLWASLFVLRIQCTVHTEFLPTCLALTNSRILKWDPWSSCPCTVSEMPLEQLQGETFSLPGRDLGDRSLCVELSQVF
jgi:hypothetical protein